MLFTSLTFALFLTIVFILYWSAFRHSLRVQNFFLLVAGYVFYGWWNWKFLGLLIAVSSVGYFFALFIQNEQLKQFRRIFFYTGIFINIGILFLFKYFNFFVEEVTKTLHYAGIETSKIETSLVIPVGISFYIFITTSYLIDVYQKKIKADDDIVAAFLSFSFFPVILAGPIQRPGLLLPQLKTERLFNHTLTVDGLRQILWGVFMKLIIADKCAPFVDDIFQNFSTLPGSTLLVGTLLFSIQIYADFAGYSNIAIGTGKLLGFRIIQNFNYPYFSRDIKSFWKKWNISLTTWFRDYVFLPVSYTVSRKIKSDRILGIKTDYLIYMVGITVTWLLTGLWHGANFTFIFWGYTHGLMLILYHITFKIRKKLFQKWSVSNNSLLVVIPETVVTLSVIMLSWIFFKSDNLAAAFSFISGIFRVSLFHHPVTIPNNLIVLILIFFITEWIGREKEYAISNLGLSWPVALRWGLYYLLIIVIFYFSGTRQEFIYFQF